MIQDTIVRLMTDTVVVRVVHRMTDTVVIQDSIVVSSYAMNNWKLFGVGIIAFLLITSMLIVGLNTGGSKIRL